MQKDFIFAESEHFAMIKIVSRNFSTKSVRKNISTYWKLKNKCVYSSRKLSPSYISIASHKTFHVRGSPFLLFFLQMICLRSRETTILLMYLVHTYFQYYKALWFAFFNYNHLLWLQSNMVAQNRMCERQQDDVVWPENSSKHSMVTRNQLTF